MKETDSITVYTVRNIIYLFKWVSANYKLGATKEKYGTVEGSIK